MGDNESSSDSLRPQTPKPSQGGGDSRNTSRRGIVNYYITIKNYYHMTYELQEQLTQVFVFSIHVLLSKEILVCLSLVLFCHCLFFLSFFLITYKIIYNLVLLYLGTFRVDLMGLKIVFQEFKNILSVMLFRLKVIHIVNLLIFHHENYFVRTESLLLSFQPLDKKVR